MCAGFAQLRPAQGPPPAVRSPRGASGRLTEMEALVADAAGRIAPDLTAADFSLESAKPMKIASCTYVDTRARRTMVFLVDDLVLTAEAIDDVRAALEKFVETAIQPDDRVAILRSGAGEGDLQQLTSDKETLHQAMARLYYNPRTAFLHLGGGPRQRLQYRGRGDPAGGRGGAAPAARPQIRGAVLAQSE